MMKGVNSLRRLAESIPFLDRSHDSFGNDVPLDELEREELLSTQSHESWWKRLVASSDWIPRTLAHIIAKRIIPFVITISILIILIMFWIRGSGRIHEIELFVPPQSITLSEDLAKELSDTPIPDYVLEYAPLVVLDTKEKFFPSDLLEHVYNTRPTIKFEPIADSPVPLALSNLATLNDLGRTDVFLTLNKNLPITKDPKFLHGDKPNNDTLKTDGISCVVIVRNHGNGIVDAFYMYFYSFNQGPTVLYKEIGDHVGDWEHNMIRFNDGTPTAVWYSQHNYGAAYAYEAVEKIGKRPVAYSAKGSHANYAVPGRHDISLIEPQVPTNTAFDYTSKGYLWDPTLSAFYYATDSDAKVFQAVRSTDPDDFLYFQGQWGDEQYPDDDPRQRVYPHGYHKYTSGPNGPIFKHLDREDVCLDQSQKCVVRTSL